MQVLWPTKKSTVTLFNDLYLRFSVFCGQPIPYPNREFLTDDDSDDKSAKVRRHNGTFFDFKKYQMSDIEESRYVSPALNDLGGGGVYSNVTAEA